MFTYKECLSDKKQIEKKVNEYDSILKSFPKQKNGLLNPIYKKMPEYIEAKNQFNFWFKNLQDINKYIMKNHKKQHNEHRKKSGISS